ncbi:prolipoprotein diacylglyceryl transferase [Salinibacterium sp. dk2585]|uniref:prolipoprotein diacylglyceryl transferase n=1 Tax=unclassified Salinibacterium TaxID=2632331 RepID=UPI0011C2531F|nr:MULTISPECIES: prolipoprotein diacylglyceryl transferase [unclassified Salinibacterium]QEE61250.1 prolipoprotein diacylglyceryl transferase [Salinibacterium sp. dk2585]TXK53926.1 prolipoprotein diacylglyceryl transferase [Salinibacterium sp. dk5596]
MFVPSSIPSPSEEWRAFNIGAWLRELGLEWFTLDITVTAYALCILTGILVAAWLTNRRLTARGAEPWIVIDVSLFAVLLGIVGARIFHVVTHPDDYFGAGADPLAVFRVWEGGIAIFGALLGGAVGAYIGCRMTGLRFWTYADALAPGLLIAQALGRFGNWFNHELFGTPTDLPWGLEIEPDNPAFPVGLPDDTLFHPTFLYEVIWNLLGAFVIIAVSRRLTLQWGRTFGLYLIWYGAGRVVWESIRVDPSEVFFGLRTNVWAAIFAIVVGIIIMMVQARRHPGLEPSPYVPGRSWEPEGVVHSDDTYSDNDDDYRAVVSPNASSDEVSSSETATSESSTTPSSGR